MMSAGGRGAGLDTLLVRTGISANVTRLRSRTRLSHRALHLAMSHSCSGALWNFQVRFGPAITLR